MPNYIVKAFTEVGPFTWEVPAGVSEVEVLVVSGGGGGGSRQGGGGGAGGLIYELAFAVSGSINGSVGAGGAGGINGGAGQNGADSVFASLVAIGGGAGGGRSSGNTGLGGGSGGGGANSAVGGGGSPGQGRPGGAGSPDQGNVGGGGGGSDEAGAAGAGTTDTNTIGGDGGAGRFFSSLAEYGHSGYFAGGGGGGIFTGQAVGAGGLGGGGDGAGGSGGSAPGLPGLDGAGGGGGGSEATSAPGGDGGSGIVLIRYAEPAALTADSTWDEAAETYSLAAEWGAITGATEYRLHLLDSSLALLQEITTTALTHTFTGLAPLTTYHLELTGLDGATELETRTLEVTTPAEPGSINLTAPTGLQVQLLEPLLDIQQNVKRTNAPLTLIEFDQYVAAGAVTFTPERTLLELSQRVTVFVEAPRRQLLAIEQNVKRIAPARQLLRLRQNVRAAYAAPEPEPGPGPTPPPPPPPPPVVTMILLDDVDITHQCSPAFQITASEGNNRTATITGFPNPGPLNITSFQGRRVDILRQISGSWTPLFTGVVDVPTYDREARTLRFQCSDLRGERLGREDRQALIDGTGGIMSPVTQREDASGEAWVRELMKTVEGSLDYNSAGTLKFRPWAVDAPRWVGGPGDVHHREIRLEFATRSEVVNSISATLEYRWYRKRTFNEVSGWSIPSSGLCNRSGCIPDPSYSLPTKASIMARDGGSLGGWRITGVSAGTPPASGWYRSSIFDSSPTGYVTNEQFRQTYATSASLSLTRWVSQAYREVYEISVAAPQSADQFGEIDGSDMRFALESDIDPGVFEQDGCAIGPDDDRRADLEEAIEAVQRMASKQIRAGHRKNYASFRYKPKGGDLLPVEIGDTIQVTADEVTVTGWVSEFTHATTVDGDRWTDLKLSVSRVDSAVSVTEDWTIPAQPTQFALNAEAAGDPADLACPGTSTNARSGVDRDGVMTFVTPTISRDKTDELVAKVKHGYELTIPVDTFEVNVP